MLAPITFLLANNSYCCQTEYCFGWILAFTANKNPCLQILQRRSMIALFINS